MKINDSQIAFSKMDDINKTTPQDIVYGLIKGGIGQEHSVPILLELKEWMLKNYKGVLPKSTIGQALHYSLERFDKLMLYTTDGRLEIDNNLVENAIRPVAVGRKNYLFAGSHNGAARAAMLYSFLGTCKLNEVNPFEWLRSTLDIIATYPINRISELLPRKV